VAEVLSDPLHKGCLVVNTSLEVAPHDNDFQKVISKVFIRIEKYLRDCIASGQADGTISTNHSAADLARLFLGVHVGIRVLARTRPEQELLMGMVRPLFGLLRHPRMPRPRGN
jgi:TetR/AcrR family transcriptional repressor of nem operon